MIRTPVTHMLALLLLASAGTAATAAGPKTVSGFAPNAVAVPSGAVENAVAAAPAGTAQNAAAAVPQFAPAPMPNPDLFAPVQRANEDPQVNPAIFRPNTQFRGDGVLPGSSAQGYEERHMIPAAGLNLQVPLK